MLVTRAKHERSDTKFAGMGVAWSPVFLSCCYPRALRHLIANFVRDIRKFFINLVLALKVTFGHESFVKGPLVRFIQEHPSVQYQGRIGDSMGETEGHAFACDVRGGSYPHSGVRGMREGCQTKRSEA